MTWKLSCMGYCSKVSLPIVPVRNRMFYLNDANLLSTLMFSVGMCLGCNVKFLMFISFQAAHAFLSDPCALFTSETCIIRVPSDNHTDSTLHRPEISSTKEIILLLFNLVSSKFLEQKQKEAKFFVKVSQAWPLVQ